MISASRFTPSTRVVSVRQVAARRRESACGRRDAVVTITRESTRLARRYQSTQALFAPLACRFMGIGCGLTAEFPPYHPLAVVCVGTGAYLLASVAAKAAAKAKKSDSKVDARTAYGLPIGAWMILGNCAIYSITSRLDKLAVLAAGKTLYYAYGRVIMASTCFLGVRPGKEAVKELTQPKVASLVLATCAVEAVYMLALYQAFACISPVYVTAIKRGGGVLLASHGGVLESRPNSKKRPLFTISRGHDTPRRPATRIKRPRHAKPPQVLR